MNTLPMCITVETLQPANTLFLRVCAPPTNTCLPKTTDILINLVKKTVKYQWLQRQLSERSPSVTVKVVAKLIARWRHYKPINVDERNYNKGRYSRCRLPTLLLWIEEMALVVEFIVSV